jgi:type VI secretion system secreted protein VgrG
MFAPANQTHFSLILEDFTGDLQVLSFTGTEGISQPYRFDVELVSEKPTSTWKNSCTSGRSWPSTHKATAFTARSTVSPRAMPASA